jgi:hypothetical protein
MAATVIGESTPVRLGAVALFIGGVAVIFSWRQEDRERLSQFERTTTSTLTEIDRKVDGLRNELNLFKVEVKAGTDDRFTRTDMQLWVERNRRTYPNLTDPK